MSQSTHLEPDDVDLLQGHQEHPRALAPEGVDDNPALRPLMLRDFHGQPRASQLLEMELCGQRLRGGNEVLDHILLYGPPGLGKTTLAAIVANEVGGRFVPLMAPSMERPAELASALVSLSAGDVLFIDEIHRLPAKLLELLYGPLEDFELNITAGDINNPRPIRIPLARFTFVGATTRPGMLPQPMRNRFGVNVMLELYADQDLATLVARSAGLLGVDMEPGVDILIAQRSRGTPRIANRFLKRVRNFAATHDGIGQVSLRTARNAFEFLGIDAHGLDERDRRYLHCLRTRFRGNPAGLSTLCSYLGEDRDTVEDEIEPWLLRLGLIDRTPRGRLATAAADALCQQGQQPLQD